MRIYIIAVLSAIIVSSCKIESQDPFVRKIENQRYTKDSLMRHDLNSPIPREDRKHFLSLAYFKPKKEYVVKGIFEPLDSPVLAVMEFSQGDDEEFFRIGTLTFSLLGKACSLSAYRTAFQQKDASISDVLFVPFWDETNGVETFEGGRYLYMNYHGTDSVQLDFNAAANPNCAYNPAKSCPVPPKENRLPFRVEAGEKKY